MARKKVVTTTSNQLDIIEFISKNEKAKNELKGLMSIKSDADAWRGMIATPAGTLLDIVTTAFKMKTDIPLELPFFSILSFASAHLTENNCSVNFRGQKVKPDLWTVLLAASGSGKTFATGRLREFTEVKAKFPECVSGAAFVDALKDYNNTLYLRDEFGHFLKNLDSVQYAEIKDYLLRVYDGSEIERKTRHEVVTIEDPCLVIQGMSVLETFSKYVSSESLLDGFAQRFSYVIAHPDPKRKMKDFPWYDLSGYSEDIRKEWNRLLDLKLHSEYTMSEGAERAFELSFQTLIERDLPASFYRRVMYKAIKYALVYHFLMGDESSEISKQDMAWAARVSYLHLQDAKELLSQYMSSDLDSMIKKAEAVKERLNARGEVLTTRKLVQYVRDIKTVATAKFVMEFM